jgi:hypothetical protein
MTTRQWDTVGRVHVKMCQRVRKKVHKSTSTSSMEEEEEGPWDRKACHNKKLRASTKSRKEVVASQLPGEGEVQNEYTSLGALSAHNVGVASWGMRVRQWASALQMKQE